MKFSQKFEYTLYERVEGLLAPSVSSRKLVDHAKLKLIAQDRIHERIFIFEVGIKRGAVGLIVPAITGIASWLTVVAAGGLAVIMLLAAGFHASRHENSSIGMNVVLLLLAVVILVGRLTFAPAYI